MSRPPADVAPDELFAKLQAQPFPTEEIDFPRYGSDGKPIQKVRIAVLPFKAHDDARKDAFRKLTDGPGKVTAESLGNVAIREVYGDAVARELLARAVLSAKNVCDDPEEPPIYGRIFPTAESIAEHLSATEIATLFAAYELAQYRYGPHFGHLSAEDIDAWVERLEIGANAFPLLEMPFPDHAELTCLLAARVSTLSRILASQRSNSDSTGTYDPTGSSAATGSSGELASEQTAGNTDSRSERPPLTLDEALRIARTLKG